MSETYTDRKLTRFTVRESSVGSCTSTDGWGWGCPVQLKEGRDYLQETKGFNTVTGVQDLEGNWLYRRSDEDLDRQHQEFQEKIKRDHEEMLAKHKDDWRNREKALPVPLRQRLINFRNHGGRNFDVGGWGYELTVCELAVLYQRSDGLESSEVTEYAKEQGTSGNQHGFAKRLAQLLDEKPEQVGQTVSALFPLTGDPFYEKEDS